MIDLVGKRNLWFLISALLLLPGLASLAINGLELSIDFTGGSSWELEMSEEITASQVRQVLENNGYTDTVVQISEGNVAIIRMPQLQQGSEERQQLLNDFSDRFGEVTELSLTTVGPTVGQEIRDRAIIAVGLASIAVLLYIAWAFRNTNNPFLYGVCAILAMVHDVLIIIGLFSILGWLAGVEVDALFVTALLTIIGYSVHDTIVLFDRVRENLATNLAPTFDETVNYSIVQTLIRSINTSLTVVLTLAALYLFGGESTRWFVFALLIGIIAGTYSSIFNAAQLLVAWESGDVKKLAFWRDRQPQQAEADTKPA